MASLDFERFALGALVHDIGKFKQRVMFPEDKGKTHSTIGYEWLSAQYGEGLISAAARDHHGHEKETWDSNLSLVIYEADNLAASERKVFDPKEDVDRAWQKDLLLASVFRRISLKTGPGLSPTPNFGRFPRWVDGLNRARRNWTRPAKDTGIFGRRLSAILKR